MTRVKICGVNRAEAFDAACDAGADWVGFVFVAKSPRFVTFEAAAALSARRAGGPARVGLFVAPDDLDISRALAVLKLDVLQVYADAARVDAIAARFGVDVWACCAVGHAGDLPRGIGAARAVVVEARAPGGAERPGGNGVAMDWGVLAGWKPGFDWVLAGGLNAGNVREAVRVSGAGAVDVSSGVERGVGVKDGAMIREFVGVVRGAA